jgi:hypothetical protein
LGFHDCIGLPPWDARLEGVNPFYTKNSASYF